MRAAFVALVLAGVAAAQGGAAAPPPPPTDSSTSGGGTGSSDTGSSGGGGGGGAAAPLPDPSSSSSSSTSSSSTTPQPSPSSSSSSSSSSQASATAESPQATQTGSPTLTFMPVPTATQCKDVTVRWQLLNVDMSKYKVSLYVFNDGVDQSIPPDTEGADQGDTSSTAAGTKAAASKRAASPAKTTAKTSSKAKTSTSAKARKRALDGSAPVHLAKRQGAMPYDYANLHLVARADTLNTSIVRDQPANTAYDWTVNVPEGRYRILGLANDKAFTWGESDAFTVVAGSDTSCVKTPSSSSSASATDASSTSEADSDAAQAGTKKKGIGGGAIAGIVIGVLAALILAVIAFCCLRKVRRDRRRDAGGLRDQPMRGLIGEPTNFRKTKGAGMGGARSSVGHALSALGFHNAEKAERQDRGIHSHPPNEKSAYPRRKSSSFTTGTGSNPFETAPSTPVEEKDRHLPPTHTPGSSFGTSIPPSSALAAGAAAGVAGSDSAHQSWRGSQQTHLSTTGYPSTSPNVDTEGGERFSGLPYDTVMLNNDGQPKEAGTRGPAPTPLHLAGATTPSGSAGAGALSPTATAPHTPVAAFTPRASGHSRSASLEGPGNPPSAFASAPNSPPQPASVQRSGSMAERKTSLRRKPVPRLSANPAFPTPERTAGGVSSAGQSAVTSPVTAGPGADADNSPPENLRLPQNETVRSGPAGDEYGLNAALGGIGQHEFSLIPDPPMAHGSDR